MTAIFAYHKTHEHGAFWHSFYWTKKKTPKVGDILYVLSGDSPKRPQYFLEGQYGITSIEPSEDDRRRLNLITLSRGPEPISISAQPWFNELEFHNVFTAGQSMNPVRQEYVGRFNEMLKGFDDESSIITDLALLDTMGLDQTERETLALARIGQGKFRENVVATWGLGETCALTGARVRSLLIASHICAWRKCTTTNERLDGANGILLCAHIDRLFDQHLVSFDDAGTIAIGPTLEAAPGALADLERLGITPQVHLNFEHIETEAYGRLIAYLDGHRALLK